MADNARLVTDIRNAYDGRDRERLERAIELITSREPSGLAVLSVVAERTRQLQVEGWDAAHDDANGSRGEMAAAAACYAMNAAACSGTFPPSLNACTDLWPWHPSWFKCTTPRRDLVKAAALILAEIERIDRTSSK